MFVSVGKNIASSNVDACTLNLR